MQYLIKIGDEFSLKIFYCNFLSVGFINFKELNNALQMEGVGFKEG